MILIDKNEVKIENRRRKMAEEAKLAKVSPETEITPQVKPAELEPKSVQAQMISLIPLAGTISLTTEQKEILYAPVQEEDIEIRPDGLVYLPWMEYVTRLREAFGLQWAIIPLETPQVKDDLILWGFYLIIQGKPAGFAFGEQEYHPTNPVMSWGDALEGAKSNALMRLCKGIGISLELWKPSFIKQWKETHAESYWKTDKHGRKKLFWRKKGQIENSEKEEEKLGVTPPQSKETESSTRAAMRKFFEDYEEKVGKKEFERIIGLQGCATIEAVLNSPLIIRQALGKALSQALQEKEKG